MYLKEELEKRGFVNQFTNDKLFDIYDKGGQSFYCGYDPSADSLTIGNFITIMTAVRFMEKWNTFYLVVGGATGMIWDPGGKDSERNFLDEKTLRYNQLSITAQVHGILANLEKISGKKLKFKVVNNYDFFKDLNVLEFLREVWKYITVNNMITKETVKKRIDDPSKSISYTEFSYTLMQGYDFYRLCKDENVLLQIAWSDQRWNITTWTELIRKKLDKEVFGFTVPLILDATGKKFWKSEWNAIWLDPKKNSPYYVYQYFMNTNDDDVERFLKLCTLLDFDKIEEIVQKHKELPELRYGQQQLSAYITETIFGLTASEQAQKISEVLFGKKDKLDVLSSMDDKDMDALMEELGWISIKEEDLPMKILDICTQTEICKSNGEAKKLIQSGAIYVNEKKIEDIQKVFKISDFVNWFLLLRKWKKWFKLVKWVGM